MKTNPTSGSNGVKVIEKAARILRVLKTNPDGMSLGKIANEVDLPRSTVQRITSSLRKERLLSVNAAGRKLRLGPELASLALATKFNTVENCREILEGLSQETGETVDLSVLRGTKMVFLDQVLGTHRLRTVSSVGDTFPLITTANGRSCLAELSNDEVENLVRKEYDEYSKMDNLNGLFEMLGQIRQNGLAYDEDEHTMGISAIGFAFRNWTGELYSISVPIPTTRYIQVKTFVETTLRNTAEQVNKIMNLD